MSLMHRKHRPNFANIVPALLIVTALSIVGCRPASVSKVDEVEKSSNVEQANQTKQIESTPSESTGGPTKIETADQYLAALANRKFKWRSKIIDLSDAEMEKLVRRLRAKYPFESLRKRLSYEDQVGRTQNKETRTPSYDLRSRALKTLHSEHVKLFVSTPGFGLTRTPAPSPRYLEPFDIEPDDIHLFTFRPGPYSNDPDLLKPLHNTFLQSFTPTFQIGAYVKSIDQVAGFRPHKTTTKLNIVRTPSQLWYSGASNQFKELTDQQKKQSPVWKFKHLQLVSLLKHDEPRVYLSEQLPNMEDLSSENAPNRALNQFETEALKKLQAGKNHVFKKIDDQILMLGAIRAQDSCLQCHSVKKDDLLGAFSYDIRVLPSDEKSSKRFDDDT